MVASLTKTQAYVVSQWESQASGSALTVTLVEDDYLWIKQTQVITSTSTTVLQEMKLESTAALNQFTMYKGATKIIKMYKGSTELLKFM